MGRLPLTPREALTEAQLRVNDLIQAGRGRSGGLAGGPFGVLRRDAEKHALPAGLDAAVDPQGCREDSGLKD